jgi:hypothetical protein
MTFAPFGDDESIAKDSRIKENVLHNIFPHFKAKIKQKRYQEGR